MSRPALTLLAARPAPRDAGGTALWAPVVSHTHLLRKGAIPPDAVPDLLAQWTRDHGVRAMGIGSPWEAVSAERYHRYEGPDRHPYYAGLVPREEAMQEAAVRGLLHRLNQQAPNRCCYYLDNETPKCRYGHIWYFGWRYLWPAWHDYDQGGSVWFNAMDTDAEINPLTGEPHRRRAYLDVVHEQRRHGALAIWAHPTSWWRHGEQFVTNIATELPLHLHADGHVDGMAIMGYQPCHRSYQALWFHLLDTGATIPGFAETDSCFDDGQRHAAESLLATRMPLGSGSISVDRIVATARRGLAYATSGPHLSITIDGVAMGSRLPTAAGMRHRVRVEAWPRPGDACLSRIELIGHGGQVLTSVHQFPGGVLEWGMDGVDQPGWVIARCWGEHADPDAVEQPAGYQFAITNPVYLGHGPAFSAVRSRYQLEVMDASPWIGGRARFTDPDGMALGETDIRPGRVTPIELPGNARVELERAGRTHAFYISSEDPTVQDLLRRLWSGSFLVGRPDLVPGEVPVEAFHVADLRQALGNAHHRI